MNYPAGLLAGLCIGASAVLTYLIYLFAWVNKHYYGSSEEEEPKEAPKKKKRPKKRKKGDCLPLQRVPPQIFAVWCEKHDGLVGGYTHTKRPEVTCACPTTMLTYKLAEIEPQEGWHHNICFTCWNERKPGRTPRQRENDDEHPCCFCRRTTRDGIYVISDPEVLLCRHFRALEREGALSEKA